MKILIKSILEKSKDRPAGYYEDVISRASSINEEYIEISKEDFVALKMKYDPIPEIELPSLFQQAKNLTSSTFNHVMNGMEEVSLPIYEERLQICRACPFMNNTDIENPRCNKCGCFLKIKAKWASESCPDTPKKWDSIPTQKMGGCGSCGGH